MRHVEFFSSVSPKGQITIPLAIRRQLGIKPKDRVAFRLNDGQVTIAAAENAFLAAGGSLPALSPPRTINEMTEIAAEEAALAAVREGLDGDDRS
jgi:AbrB family looped-hinge helix DNA binding protein